MRNIKPCPYCGGEVEVVKLVKRKNESFQPYRIECLTCRRLVARGQGFKCENKFEAKKRITQYENEIKRMMGIIKNKENDSDV